MTVTKLDVAVQTITELRDKARTRYDTEAAAGDMHATFYWRGIESAYDVALVMLDQLRDDDHPICILPPVSSVCPDCRHPAVAHDDAHGCNVNVTLAGGASGSCVCLRSLVGLRRLALR